MWRGGTYRGVLHKATAMLPLHRKRGEAPGRSCLGDNPLQLHGFSEGSPQKEAVQSHQKRAKLDEGLQEKEEKKQVGEAGGASRWLPP